MTISQLRNFCNKKPSEMSWSEFDNLDVTVTTDFGMEHLAEFEESMGVVAVPMDDGSVGFVFNLMTEDIEDCLYSSDELDEFEGEGFSAMDELRMYNVEDLEHNKN